MNLTWTTVPLVRVRTAELATTSSTRSAVLVLQEPKVFYVRLMMTTASADLVSTAALVSTGWAVTSASVRRGSSDRGVKRT